MNIMLEMYNQDLNPKLIPFIKFKWSYLSLRSRKNILKDEIDFLFFYF